MTRKHFEHLARTLGVAVAIEGDGGPDATTETRAAYRVALAVARSLHAVSDTYDEARFMDAVDKHAQDWAQYLARDGEGVGYSRAARIGMDDAMAQRLAHPAPYARGDV